MKLSFPHKAAHSVAQTVRVLQLASVSEVAISGLPEGTLVMRVAAALIGGRPYAVAALAAGGPEGGPEGDPQVGGFLHYLLNLPCPSVTPASIIIFISLHVSITCCSCQ